MIVMSVIKTGPQALIKYRWHKIVHLDFLASLETFSFQLNVILCHRHEPILLNACKLVKNFEVRASGCLKFPLNWILYRTFRKANYKNGAEIFLCL